MNILDQFDSISYLKQVGFQGFVSIKQALKNTATLPTKKGLYLVLSHTNPKQQFLERGTGGFFKGKNPNVLKATLRAKWVPGSIVLYIGQAGGGKSTATLKTRLNQYLKFGQGYNIGHWGGRYIWQLKDSGKLILCWQTLPNGDPRQAEKETIKKFKARYGSLPFTNLRG